MRRIRLRTASIALLICGTLLDAALTPALPQDSRIEQVFAKSLTEVPTQPLQLKGSVYVPAYSSVALSQGKARADFSVTLTVNNVSEERPLVLTRIAFFDTSGNLVESFLTRPIALKPFAAVEVYIAVTDLRGGTGANFIVDWAATDAIAEPVIEALMLGGIGAGHYAFISPGRTIRVVRGN